MTDDKLTESIDRNKKAVALMGKLYKIESGTPVPNMGKQAQPVRFPFSEMQIGDRFFVTVEGALAHQREYAKLQKDKLKYKRQGHAMFDVTCRTAEGGFYVWRVA